MVLRAAAAQVQHEAVDFKPVGLARVDLSAGESAQAGHQLAKGERLRQVIVGTGVETFDAVADGGAAVMSTGSIRLARVLQDWKPSIKRIRSR
jgi:hypothetical protein